MRRLFGAGVDRDRLARWLWIGSGAGIVFNVLLLGWILFKPGSHGTFTAVDNIAQVVGTVLLLPLSFWGYRSAIKQRGHLLAPILLGLGVFGFALGQGIWTYYEQVLQQATPFPSIADIFFL